MPKMDKVFSLTITPEQFLNACDPIELQEVELLINSNRFRSRMPKEDEIRKSREFPSHVFLGPGEKIDNQKS